MLQEREDQFMTIEIADRLIKLRKKNGYSQEELADKLGLSRQAVSKWERAEASPDTDNLICLAKLYGISLDELLSTDDDVETIVKEQVKHEETKEKEGIHIVDDEGNKVEIDNNHIHCYNKDGKEMKKIFPDRFSVVISAVEGGLFVLSIVAYILLGTLCGYWSNAWITMLIPGIICSIVRAIYRKNAAKVNMVFIAIYVYFFVCMAYPGLETNLWHPTWLVFLSIPLYYTLVGVIHKITNRHLDEDEDD